MPSTIGDYRKYFLALNSHIQQHAQPSSNNITCEFCFLLPNSHFHLNIHIMNENTTYIYAKYQILTNNGRFLLCSRHRRKICYTFTQGVLLSLYYNCGAGYIVSNKVSSSLGYYSCTASSSFTLLISTEYNNVSILSLNILFNFHAFSGHTLRRAFTQMVPLQEVKKRIV